LQRTADIESQAIAEKTENVEQGRFAGAICANDHAKWRNIGHFCLAEGFEIMDTDSLNTHGLLLCHLFRADFTAAARLWTGFVRMAICSR
jgi:hypothetical protein